MVTAIDSNSQKWLWDDVGKSFIHIGRVYSDKIYY